MGVSWGADTRGVLRTGPSRNDWMKWTVPPDRRGSFGQELDSPQQTDEWRKKLGAMVKELQK